MTRINTNVPSLVAQNRLQSSNSDLQTALTRLSTGLRINSGADDPAGLIASEALRSEITSLGKAISNTRRASQIISTADSALGEVSNLLNDIRGLVVEAANSGALSDSEIAANQLQVDSSLEAINRIAQTTTFQGRKLIDGSLAFLTEAGTNFSTVTDLQIDQANLGTTGSVSVDVTVTAAAQQAQVEVANIPVATADALSTGTLTLDRTITAVDSAGSIDFSRTTAAVQATSGTVSSSNAGDFTVTAKSGGAFADAALNGFTLNVSTTAAAGGSASTIAVDTLNSEIDIVLEEGETLADIATLLSGNADLDFSSAETVLTVDNTTTAAGALGSGSASSTTTAALTLTDTGGGATVNGATITFAQADGVAVPTAVVDGSGNITITVEDTDSVNLSDIESAINTEGTYTASLDVTGGLTAFDADAGTDTATVNNFANGVDASTATALINLSALTPGAAADGATITFAEVDGTAAPVATVDGSGNITITVDDDTDANIADILAAINTEGTYSATADAGNTLTAYNGTTDTSSTTAFAGGSAASGGLAANVVFELQGSTGSEVFNVSAGTSIDELISQINLVSDATGVIAVADGTTLQLTSSNYGSDAVVDLRVIEEAASGTFTTEIGAGVRDEGTDIVAKVNGVDASGDGNTLKINTATLDLSITVDEGSSANFGFTINGGGALFQLGADVVGNQQARIGINSVNTARLGGPAGKLFQLTSGQSAALATDPNSAAKIVTEAIKQVTGLRGRLGAFQATTLDSNLVSLSETQANLLEAESSIRDADFAQESANLTRAQILVQSGTNVLSLANQNPQNVLSLLR